MQGPRFPSHKTSNTLITLHRPDQSPKKERHHREEDDRDGRSDGDRDRDRQQQQQQQDEDNPKQQRAPPEEQVAPPPIPPQPDAIELLEYNGLDPGGTGDAGGAGGNDESTCRRSIRSSSRTNKVVQWGRRHLRFIGPGLIASAAYLDPGNYATNLQAGSTNGYKLLFIVLLSGLIGIMMQILAARLGIVTGKDIAQLCRQTLHSRPKHTMLYRWGMLYPLYIIAESGIIFTDLAELLGTAIAFNLLIPKIPLYAGVLLTSLDVFVVLIVFNSYPNESRNKSITAFEILISAMVLTVLSSFLVLLVRLSPDWGDVFEGYLPSSTIIGPGALYISVGIIGATVMPHALFLGAKLGTIRRIEEDHDDVDNESKESKVETGRTSPQLSEGPVSIPISPRLSLSHGAQPRARSTTINQLHSPSLHMPYSMPMPRYPLEDTTKTERSARFIRIHLHHAQIDIAYSLVCFALVTNSAILTVAGAAFYYRDGNEDTSGVQEGDLFSAHALIKSRVGTAFAFLFALALMMSGQAASITATLAGQVVSEGFINWRTTPWKRRLITRCISMVPSLIVAVAAGQKGVNTLLVASQVTLSLVLPFVLGPLVAFTCRQNLMSIPDPTYTPSSVDAESAAATRPRAGQCFTYLNYINPFASRPPPAKGVLTFANNFFIMGLAWAIFAVICIADVYALIQLGNGEA